MTDTERIEQLERRVKQLEAQPKETHFHYYPPVYQQPYAPPAPYVQTHPILNPMVTWGGWPSNTAGTMPLDIH